MAQKPNPNDPSLVDVFDDATGAYLTTIPKESAALQQLVQGPPPTQQPAPAPQFNMEADANTGSLGVLSVGSADAPKPAPAGDAAKVSNVLQGTADPTGAPLQPPAQGDVQSLVETMKGSADMQQEPAAGCRG